ncbi:hypothetical protein [Nonomuraea sp. CA-141351]|uniref:hypothetical protein n=1 Tax=Nonomuraea sp. CA-141351 TaxID=3239996 RepID=UPI003D8EF253
MRDRPSSRLTRRAMSGRWERFPVSPDPVYRLLDAAVDVAAWRYAEAVVVHKTLTEAAAEGEQEQG